MSPWPSIGTGAWRPRCSCAGESVAIPAWTRTGWNWPRAAGACWAVAAGPVRITSWPPGRKVRRSARRALKSEEVAWYATPTGSCQGNQAGCAGSRCGQRSRLRACKSTNGRCPYLTTAWLSSSGALSACLTSWRSAPTDHDWSRSSSTSGPPTEVAWHRAISHQRPALGQRARCVPDRAVNRGKQRSLTDKLIRPPTWEQAGTGGDQDGLLSSRPRQFDFGPGRFPQCAHGHPDALAGRGHGRPEPEVAVALMAGEAAP